MTGFTTLCILQLQGEFHPQHTSLRRRIAATCSDGPMKISGKPCSSPEALQKNHPSLASIPSGCLIHLASESPLVVAKTTGLKRRSLGGPDHISALPQVDQQMRRQQVQRMRRRELDLPGAGRDGPCRRPLGL